MQELSFELSVGDVLQVGDQLVTVVDIDGPEVTFRIDRLEPDSDALPLETCAAVLPAR
jgi:hypothetical protein